VHRSSTGPRLWAGAATSRGEAHVLRLVPLEAASCHSELTGGRLHPRVGHSRARAGRKRAIGSRRRRLGDRRGGDLSRLSRFSRTIFWPFRVDLGGTMGEHLIAGISSISRLPAPSLRPASDDRRRGGRLIRNFSAVINLPAELRYL
jgi:hypothetical protein